MAESLGIVIVSYHDSDQVIKYIENEVIGNCGFAGNIVVVDNSKSQSHFNTYVDFYGNRAHLLSWNGLTFIPSNSIKSSLFIVRNFENGGYAKGCNLGVRCLEFFGAKNEAYLFSNSDIEIRSKNVLSVLMSKFKLDDKIGAINPTISDGSIHHTPYQYINFSTWSFSITLGFIIKMKHIILSPPTQAFDSGYYYRLSGSFLMVKRDALLSVNGFDENTFLYGEELILAERLKAIGLQSYYDSSVEIVHKRHGTIGSVIKPLRDRTIMMDSVIYYYTEYKGVSPRLAWVVRQMAIFFYPIDFLFSCLRKVR